MRRKDLLWECGLSWAANGVFRDGHKDGRFLKLEIGEVKVVRISRFGIAIVDCIKNKDKVLK